jgi:hypothetical protein
MPLYERILENIINAGISIESVDYGLYRLREKACVIYESDYLGCTKRAIEIMDKFVK